MKAKIYHSRISPLMTQIIEICKQYNIAFIASFAIPTAAAPGLECTSSRLVDECNPPAHLLQALWLIRGDVFLTAARTLVTDGTKIH